MKPYGRIAKVCVGPCGCCVSGRSDDDDLLPWRGKAIRNAAKKKYKHKARQNAKKETSLATSFK